MLGGAGITSVGDLQDYSGDLRALVGSFGPKLRQFAFGEDDRPLEIGDEIKSISGEETFLQDGSLAKDGGDDTFCRVHPPDSRASGCSAQLRASPKTGAGTALLRAPLPGGAGIRRRRFVRS